MLTSPPSDAAPSATRRRRGRAAKIFTPIAMVVLLVGGAWYIGGQEGFSKIGGGGMNLRLLPKVGDPAPDFLTYTARDGTPVLLSSYRGTPVWLNFWGSWCPPCRAEFPDLEAAYTDVFQPAGVALLAISLDEPAQAAWGYASRNGGTFTILSDPNRRDTGGAYPIANFPTHILIDRKGIVRAIILAPYNKDELVKAVQVIISP